MHLHSFWLPQVVHVGNRTILNMEQPDHHTTTFTTHRRATNTSITSQRPHRSPIKRRRHVGSSSSQQNRPGRLSEHGERETQHNTTQHNTSHSHHTHTYFRHRTDPSPPSSSFVVVVVVHRRRHRLSSFIEFAETLKFGGGVGNTGCDHSL